MIDYETSRWYGLLYLTKLQGILLPRLLPVIIIAATLAGLVASEAVEAFNWCPQDEGGAKAQFAHPYAFQLYGIVFGYMSIARLNISFGRYWEGVTHLKTMHSKWTDATLQILSFDRQGNTAVSLEDEPFCRHIVHLIKQLSALATVALHGEPLKKAKPSRGLLQRLSSRGNAQNVREARFFHTCTSACRFGAPCTR